MVPYPQMPELLPMDISEPAQPMIQTAAAAAAAVAMAKEEAKAENPFEILIKAAKLQNPKQFEMPEALMVFAPLPGKGTRLNAHQLHLLGLRKRDIVKNNGMEYVLLILYKKMKQRSNHTHRQI